MLLEVDKNKYSIGITYSTDLLLDNTIVLNEDEFESAYQYYKGIDSRGADNLFNIKERIRIYNDIFTSGYDVFYYNATKMLSFLVYDFKKNFHNNDLIKVEDFLNIENATVSYFASFLYRSRIKELRILDINKAYSAYIFSTDANTNGIRTHYIVYQGTDPSKIKEYITKHYICLYKKPKNILNSSIEYIKQNSNDQFIITGHSYGAWLAHELKNQISHNTWCRFYLYHPPFSILKKDFFCSECLIDRRFYMFWRVNNVYIQTNFNDPIGIHTGFKYVPGVLKLIFSLYMFITWQIVVKKFIWTMFRYHEIKTSFFSDELLDFVKPISGRYIHSLRFKGLDTFYDVNLLLNILEGNFGCMLEDGTLYSDYELYVKLSKYKSTMLNTYAKHKFNPKKLFNYTYIRLICEHYGYNPNIVMKNYIRYMDILKNLQIISA